MPQLRLSSIILVAAIGCSAIPAMAQESKSSGTGLKLEELTPEELREREARKSCKVAICAAFRNRKPDGGDISCNVIKSWRKEQLSKMVERATVSWPWGRVKCTAPINLKRDTLIKAMTEPAYEATLDTHKVA